MSPRYLNFLLFCKFKKEKPMFWNRVVSNNEKRYIFLATVIQISYKDKIYQVFVTHLAISARPYLVSLFQSLEKRAALNVVLASESSLSKQSEKRLIFTTIYYYLFKRLSVLYFIQWSFCDIIKRSLVWSWIYEKIWTRNRSLELSSVHIKTGWKIIVLNLIL